MPNSNDLLEQKVVDLLNNRFPLSDAKGRYSFALEGLEVKRPAALGDISKEYDLKLSGKDMNGKARARIALYKDGKKIDETGKMDIVSIPYKSNRGTYIVGGKERVILNQLRSKPGPYTEFKDGDIVKTQIMFDNRTAPRIDMELDGKKDTFIVTVGKTNFPGIRFLQYIGCSDAEIRNAIGRDAFADRLMANPERGARGTLESLFNLIVNHGAFKSAGAKFPKNPALATAMIQEALSTKASFGDDGAEVAETNIGLRTPNFNKDSVLATVKKTFDVFRGSKPEDDRDDLMYQRVYSGEDLIFSHIENDVEAFASNLQAILDNAKTISLASIPNSLRRLGRSLNTFMTTGRGSAAEGGSLSEHAEETNPLQLFSSQNKITLLGPGGISDNAKNTLMSPRNLRNTGINRLDPVHTPESGNIGLVNYLAQDAKIKDGTITAEFLKVVRGKAVDKASNIVELTPKEEFESYIAFHDLKILNRNGNTITFNRDKVPARYRGKLMDVEVDKIQYLDRRPQAMFDIATNLVPFGHHNDGNRMLMGANMQTQALNLINREAPLVQVATDPLKRKTMEEELGEKSFIVKAPASGVVSEINGNDSIVIKDTQNKEHTVQLYNYFPLNGQNFIKNDILVKVGDKVQKGQLIAEGWQTRGGVLALGTNARVGYMPFKGYNYEDGIVISESFANKMTSEETIVEDIVIRERHIGGPGSGAKKLMKEHVTAVKSLDKLDDDGIIRVGSQVNPGDIIVARLKPTDLDQMDSSLKLYNQLMGRTEKMNDASYYIPRSSYTRGKVIGIETVSGAEAGEADAKWVIKVLIASAKPLKLGDKLAGRHGNKGTITKVLPDSSMPTSEDGKPLDLIFSPLAVPSRKNLGQLLEVNAGLVAEKQGKPFKVVNFDPKAKDEVLQGLKEIGVPDGKMKLIDPETKNPYENPVTVGNMYIMKLKHVVDDKLQSRSALEGSPPQKTFYEPSKSLGSAAGEKHNPQKLGEMEMWGLQAHKAVHNILEATTLKGDGAGDKPKRISIFRALSGESKLDTLADSTGTPESLKILADNLSAMGLKMTPMHNGNAVKTLDQTFSELMLTPMKDEQVIELIGPNREVKSARKYEAKKSGDDVAEVGGLYDPRIFGEQGTEESRKNWGYIRLNHPLPNPLLLNDTQYNPYAELTGYTRAQLNDIMTKGVVLITNPGDSGLKEGEIISADQAEKLIFQDGKKFESAIGGNAIMHLLKKVDLNKEFRDTEAALKESSGKDRDKLYKRYRTLTMLKQNNLKPEDLMLRIVPVTPTYLRPRLQQGKNVITGDLTTLYSRIITRNNNTADTLADPSASPVEAARDSEALYRDLSNLYGVTRYKEPSGQEMGGLKGLIGGKDKGKEGLARDRMLGKKVDYSGRAVIGVDPNLHLNQVGIPIDIAKNVYKPFIVKELVNMGLYTHKEAEDKLKDRELGEDVKKAIGRVVKDRPIIINRAPSLHKFSIQAFEPVVKDYEDGKPVRNIQLNPLVVTGFNADFDGDQMAVHVPLTEKSKEEAKKLMMPSENLINPTNGKMIIDIRHEMLLGIYYLTMNADKPEGRNKTFNSYQELYDAFKKGDIRARSKVTLNNRTTTAGQILFNEILPPKYQQWGKTVGRGPVRAMLTEMHDDKSISTMELSNLIDKIKDLGFTAATRSALSINIQDFKQPGDLGSRIDDVVKNLDKGLEKDDQALIAAYTTLEDELEKELSKGEILDPNNPVQIMMSSKARGDAGQVRRMGLTVGVGRDMTGKMIQPIKSSHLDGLSPQEFWLHSYDSRKGMADRALSTAKPGYLSRRAWNANQDVVVKEKDCKTKEGIKLLKNNNTIVGRYTAKAIKNQSGKVYAGVNTLITKQLWDTIQKDDQITEVWVRSPMTCETVNGVCQMCYGAIPGTMQLATLGEPIGVLASQALGEPVTQMTMKTFHGGGTSSNVTLGFPRIEQLMTVSQNPDNKAILARNSGTVKVTTENGKTIVYVGKAKHIIDKGIDGKVKPLKVKDGDYVKKGDFLTLGDVDDMLNPSLKNMTLTNASPGDILKLTDDPKKAVRQAQDYLATSMEYAFDNTIGDGAIDRRHIEVTIGKLTSKVKITDPGTSRYLPGQIVDRFEVEKWNKGNTSSFGVKTVNINDTYVLTGSPAAATYRDKKRNVIVQDKEEITRDKLGKLMMAGHKNIKIYPKPIKYEPVLDSINKAPTSGHDNWFSNLGYEDVGKQLARGATFGQTDKLEDIRGRQMSGKLLNIGSGFDLWTKTKDKANSFANSLLNMFR